MANANMSKDANEELINSESVKNLTKLLMKAKRTEKNAEKERHINDHPVSAVDLLGLLFLTLKLTDHIDWSWWWVSAPFWVPLIIIFFVEMKKSVNED